MKLRIAFLLALVGLFASSAKAYDFAIPLRNGDSLYFNITDAVNHKVEVTAPVSGRLNYYYGHPQPSGVVVIPETVEFYGERYEVSTIGERAFSGCSKIQLVVIPATVHEIGRYAFYGCTGIKGRVTIGENIRFIGESAFYGCSLIPEVNFRAINCVYMGGSIGMTVFGNCRSLRKIIIDDGVRRIPDYAFCGVDAITDSLLLPQSLEYIGKYAFAYCSNLSGNVAIPDRVDTIGECAFHQCHTIKSVTLGTSLKSVGARAFYHCVGLKQVKVTALHPTPLATTAFSDIPKTTKFLVPCVSKSLYEQDPLWKKYAPFATYGNCTFTVRGLIDTAVAGVIVGSGQYAYGDSVTLIAVCAAGYGFEGWADGVKENPRRFQATDSVSLMALTRPSGTLLVRDTLYQVDTVFEKGVKVIHDTVDIVDVATSINTIKEVQFDSAKKNLRWNFPRNEKVINVSLYNQIGQCLHYGDGRKGNLNLRRYPTGVYILRIETLRRVIRCRFFMSAESGYLREMSVQ